jgi:molybdate transport system substrate-binding protein
VALVLLAGASLGDGEAGADEDATVLAAGAISLRDVLREAVAEFEGSGGTEVRLHTASSGALMRQIESGAPVDVFFSASPVEIDHLEEAGLLESGTRRAFASNRVVVVAAPGEPLPSRIDELGASRFPRVCLGNPKTVPAGRYARQALVAVGVWDSLESRAIYAENVRQVVEYVARGDVPVGLVYRTDALRFRDRLAVGPVAPESSHAPIRYEAAVIRDARNRVGALRFLRFVASGKGRAILERHGFLGAPDE